MPVAIGITPASGSITAKRTACRIDVTGADNSTPSYLVVDAPTGTDDGRYVNFIASGTGSNGAYTWNNYIFPIAGSYTLRLKKVSDNSDLATTAVTVS